MNNSTFGNISLVRASVHVTYHKSLVVLVAVVLPLNICGAIANAVTFIATITYGPLHRSSSCVLLAHCMLIDFVITLCIEPGMVLVTYFGFLRLPDNFCRCWGAIIFSLTFATNWAHGVLALNRFTAAIFPHQYKHLTTRLALTLAVALPWVIAVGVNVFPVAEIGTHYAQTSPWGSCLPVPPVGIAQTIINFVAIYVPCLIIGLSYSIVLINARVVIRRRVGNVARQTALQKRYEVSMILLMCFLWFCLSNFLIPMAIYFYPEMYVSSPRTQLALKGLQYLSSTVNPVFFLLVSNNYRNGAVAVMTCQIFRENGSGKKSADDRRTQILSGQPSGTAGQETSL